MVEAERTLELELDDLSVSVPDMAWGLIRKKVSMATEK